MRREEEIQGTIRGAIPLKPTALAAACTTGMVMHDSSSETPNSR